MKKIIATVLIVVVVVIGLLVVKDLVIKVSVEKGVALVTGLRLTIGSLKADIFGTLVDIRNMKLYNPSGYPDKIMMDMPKIYVNYDLPSMFRNVMHFEEIAIDLKEFIVVKNRNGELNLNSLKVVQAEKQGRKPQDKEKKKAPGIQIDMLKLKIGRVLYKDYSQGGAPSVKEFNININERYSDIRDPYTLVSLIVVKSMMNTNISNLAGFNLQGLSGTVSDTLGTAQKMTTQVMTTAQTAAKQTTAVAKESQEAVKKATEAITEVFKNPFGGGK